MKAYLEPKHFTPAPGTWRRPENAVLYTCGTERDFSLLASFCGMQWQKAPGRQLRAWCGVPDEKLTTALHGSESYAMHITEDGVTIAADEMDGLSQGVKALWRMLDMKDTLPCGRIDDEPTLQFRAVHLCIFPDNDGTQKEDTSPDAVRAMLRHAAYHGYNRVFMEFWGVFPYSRRPYACWPNQAYTREIVNSLIDEASLLLHMTPLPVQNLTSHAGWSRIASRKHVVLDQRPELADMWIPGGWCFATENPDTKAYLKDIADDLIEAYHQPPIFHVSTDKCFGFGSSEADRVHDADSLFLRHLYFLHDMLAERGARMMMWGDMLYGALDSKFWKASPSLTELLPRDILINVWTHNDPGQCWPDVAFFQGKGFETVYSPFINESSIHNMVSICQKMGSLGLVQTTWHKPQTAMPYVALSGKLQWEGEKQSSAK